MEKLLSMQMILKDSLADLVQPYPIDYSILGFGSKSYPKYCQFAITLETLFKKNLNFNELTPLFKINNQSETDYLIWEKNNY